MSTLRRDNGIPARTPEPINLKVESVILAGLALPDAGEIRLRGRPVRFQGARDADVVTQGVVQLRQRGEGLQRDLAR